MEIAILENGDLYLVCNFILVCVWMWHDIESFLVLERQIDMQTLRKKPQPEFVIDVYI